MQVWRKRALSASVPSSGSTTDEVVPDIEGASEQLRHDRRERGDEQRHDAAADVLAQRPWPEIIEQNQLLRGAAAAARADRGKIGQRQKDKTAVERPEEIVLMARQDVARTQLRDDRRKGAIASRAGHADNGEIDRRRR